MVTDAQRRALADLDAVDLDLIINSLRKQADNGGLKAREAENLAARLQFGIIPAAVAA